MAYTAVYRDENKNLRSIRHEGYNTKSSFAKDLRRNAMPVIAILTDEQITNIKNGNFHLVPSFIRLDFEFVKECL